MLRIAVIGAGRIGKVHAATVAAHPQARLVLVCDPFIEAAKALAEPLGARASADAAEAFSADDVDAVVIGSPTPLHAEHVLAAARAGKRLLLANKEALVVGGSLFMRAVREGGATLLPIDSEHSAIFQSLPEDPATWGQRVERIILTASGGPFRTWEPARLRSVTPEQACAHPNWRMGRKISVDSATMVNKALEIIEARWLFGMPPEKLCALIHPQSVIHSMVQYLDGSIVAQLGTPDMRVPIAYGLAWPQRMASGSPALDFGALQGLTFEDMQSHGHPARFPSLALVWQVLRAPEGACAIFNAANEVAVEAFLQGRIRFDQIHAVIQSTLEAAACHPAPDLPALLALDASARRTAQEAARKLA